MPRKLETLIYPSAARRRAILDQNTAIDLKDPDLHIGGSRDQVFAKLRSESPVHWNPEVESRGFWAVTRYADVTKVLQDPDTFSADVQNGGMRIFDAQDVTATPAPHVLSMDPPKHGQLRKALQPLFSQANVEYLQSSTQRRAILVIDSIASKGRAEFVSEVAAPFTLGLLTDLLDVPEEHANLLLRWSNMFVGDDDPDYQVSAQVRQQAASEMDEYALKLFEVRNDPSKKDFVSLLRHAELDGRPLDSETFSANFAAFLVAANETTRHAISASIVALSENPAEKGRLLNDPSLIPTAAKELIRWASPLMHVRRTAMRDVVLGGQKINKDDKVVVWYGSANRDAAVWSDSERLDLTRYYRNSAPHLSFGVGPHHCLGWRLAEMQLVTLLQILLHRLPDVRVARPGKRLRSNFIGGYKSLEVEFTPN